MRFLAALAIFIPSVGFYFLSLSSGPDAHVFVGWVGVVVGMVLACEAAGLQLWTLSADRIRVGLAAVGSLPRLSTVSRAARCACGSPPRLAIRTQWVASCQCGRRSRRWLFQEHALADLAGRPIFQDGLSRFDLTLVEKIRDTSLGRRIFLVLDLVLKQ